MSGQAGPARTTRRHHAPANRTWRAGAAPEAGDLMTRLGWTPAHRRALDMRLRTGPRKALIGTTLGRLPHTYYSAVLTNHDAELRNPPALARTIEVGVDYSTMRRMYSWAIEIPGIVNWYSPWEKSAAQSDRTFISFSNLIDEIYPDYDTFIKDVRILEFHKQMLSGDYALSVLNAVTQR